MAEFVIPKHGTICWRELGTSDPAMATAFYQELFGWRLQQSKGAAAKYDEIVTNGVPAGGIIPAGEGKASRWLTYIAADDLDATTAKIVANGGKINTEGLDVPGVGRIAIAEDPTGAPFALIQFAQPENF